MQVRKKGRIFKLWGKKSTRDMLTRIHFTFLQDQLTDSSKMEIFILVSLVGYQRST